MIFPTNHLPELVNNKQPISYEAQMASKWQFTPTFFGRRLKLNFSQNKNKKSLFEPPFGGLRGNVHTLSISHWKAHAQLPICHN